MKRINHALIMAAGEGTRMYPITEYIPKAMVMYNDSTLISEIIKKLHNVVGGIHITIGYKSDLLTKYITKKHPEVSTFINTNKKGNTWWLYNTLIKNLNEPIVVSTCDNICDLDYEEVIKEYNEQGQPVCMIVPVHPVEGIEGDFIKKDNDLICGITRQERSDLYCSGIQILNPYKINLLTKETENFSEVWRQLIEQDRLVCSKTMPKKWLSIDNIEQLKLLKNV